MLKQRVITALLLLPVLLGMIWFAPTPWLYAFFSAAGLMIAWEWTGLMRPLGQSAQRYLFVALVAAALYAVWITPAQYRPWLFGLAGLWWVFAFTLVSGFPANFERHPPSVTAMGVLGVVLISSTLLALATLHAMPNGVLRLIYLFFLIFAADTGAYFAGRTFGKHKLAPNVSPGKTVEGAVGGVLLCGVWALVGGHYIFQAEGNARIALFSLSRVVAVFSIIGDLTESMFKRVAGIKDSGNILPGHGGILDRVDSILSAAPVMVLGLQLLQI